MMHSIAATVIQAAALSVGMSLLALWFEHFKSGRRELSPLEQKAGVKPTSSRSIR